MKMLKLLLVLALLVVGVAATVLPSLASPSTPSSAAPVILRGEPTPTPALAPMCFPPPCDCIPNC